MKPLPNPVSTAPATNAGCPPAQLPHSTSANPRHSDTAATMAARGPRGSCTALRERRTMATNTTMWTVLSTVPYVSPSNAGRLANAVVAW